MIPPLVVLSHPNGISAAFNRVAPRCGLRCGLIGLWAFLPTAVLAQDDILDDILAPDPTKNDAAQGIDSEPTVLPDIETSLRADEIDRAYVLAKNNFEYGKCGDVISYLRPIIDKNGIAFIDDIDRVADIYRMLGICYSELGQNELAKEAFQQLLYTMPSVDLDTFSTPPKALAIFLDVKKALQEKLDAILQNHNGNHDHNSTDGQTVLIERTTVIKERPFVLVFAPFGISQFVIGDNAKGTTFAALQGATLGINVAAYWYMQSLRLPNTPQHVASESDVAAFRAAQLVQVASFGAAALSYAISVGDAWWNFQAQSTSNVSEERTVLPKGAPLPGRLAPR